jgi:hypothetical protein
MIVIACLFLVCCDIGPKKRVTNFYQVTPDSRLYFQNIRQHKYLPVPMEGTNIKMLRHRGYQNLKTQHALLLTIADNYLFDEAYLTIENDYLFTESDTATMLIQEASGKQTRLPLVKNRRPQQYEALYDVFLGMKRRSRILLELGSEQVDLTESSPVRDAIFTTLRDYFELTNKI